MQLQLKNTTTFLKVASFLLIIAGCRLLMVTKKPCCSQIKRNVLFYATSRRSFYTSWSQGSKSVQENSKILKQLNNMTVAGIILNLLPPESRHVGALVKIDHITTPCGQCILSGNVPVKKRYRSVTPDYSVLYLYPNVEQNCVLYKSVLFSLFNFSLLSAAILICACAVWIFALFVLCFAEN